MGDFCRRLGPRTGGSYERRMVCMNAELSVVGTLASKDMALFGRLAFTRWLFSVDDGNDTVQGVLVRWPGLGF